MSEGLYRVRLLLLLELLQQSESPHYNYDGAVAAHIALKTLKHVRKVKCYRFDKMHKQTFCSRRPIN
jgi:hypothetical protein